MLHALLALSLVAPARAEDVIAPDPTPRSLEDFTLAFAVQEALLEALRAGGVDVVDADTMRKWAVPAMDGCAENAECLTDTWPATDARLAIVMLAGRVPGGIDVEVRLHGADAEAPFKVYADSVKDGEEPRWARETARRVRDALALMPERSIAKPELRKKGAKTRASVVAPPPADDVDVAPPSTQNPTAFREEGDEFPDLSGAPRRKAGADARSERQRDRDSAELAKLHLPRGAVQRFERSGLSLDAWKGRARVRSGQMLLEFNGGYGLGATDRGYSVRTKVTREQESLPSGAVSYVYNTTAASTWQGIGAGDGVSVGGSLGYAPTWWLDTSLHVGVQFGRNLLVAGYECPEGCDPPSGTFAPEPARAAQLLLEPRVRLWATPTGIAKPYALVGFTTLVHGPIVVPDGDVIYPDAETGYEFGPMGGAGLTFDATPFFSVYVESPVTWLIPRGDGESLNAAVQATPLRLEGTRVLVRPGAGVAIRF
ncbi:MAG: hypothetical protein RLZZ299_1487 [Pseudomonadota bacterium]|jgi:hypothetical protein